MNSFHCLVNGNILIAGVNAGAGAEGSRVGGEAGAG